MREFPVPEDRSALNPAAQFAWLAAEMDYSQKKAPYREKRRRLSLPAYNPEAVFIFMSNYWGRFLTFNDELHQRPDQVLAAKALQYHAKVVAGVCDKVALTFWMEALRGGKPEDKIDPLVLIRDSLSLVEAATRETPYNISQLLPLQDADFEYNPMGQAVLNLHELYYKNPNDIDELRALALGGAAGGVAMLGSYVFSLVHHPDPAFQQLNLSLPKPGVTSGEILPW